MSKLALGDRSRCQTCGGKIVLVKDPRVISLSAAIWIHVGVRRVLAAHYAKGPTS